MLVPHAPNWSLEKSIFIFYVLFNGRTGIKKKTLQVLQLNFFFDVLGLYGIDRGYPDRANWILNRTKQGIR